MKLPKTLYVSVENTGSGHKDDEFLNATNNPADHACVNEVTQVGRYQLIEVGTMTAEPIFVPGQKVRS